MINIRWIFDLDGTICNSNYTLDKWDYINSTPRFDIIEKINKLYDMGEYITIFTARGSIIKKDWEGTTKKQLKEWGVKYNELKFGKPGGEIYVDDRTITPNEFLDKYNMLLGIAGQWKKKA